MRSSFYLLIGCLLGILGGCIHQNPQQHAIWREEALLYDVPILLGAKPNSQYTYNEGDRDLVLSYEVQSKKDKVIAFYTEQMELYGWRHKSTIDGAETLLLFEKPRTYCMVVIRYDKVNLKEENQLLIVVIFRGICF